MKKTIIALFIGTSVLGYGQAKKTTTTTTKTTTKKDSIFIYYEKDEMTDKVYYFPSGKIAIIDEPRKMGFSVSAFVEDKDNEIQIRDLEVKMINIGSCVEDNEIIFLFEDGSKINLKSWNDFNCEGNAWFSVTESDKESLSKKKINKIKVTNGRSFESLTGEVSENRKSFFIELYSAVENKKIKEYKTK